jgi:hypothetical protein
MSDISIPQLNDGLQMGIIDTMENEKAIFFANADALKRMGKSARHLSGILPWYLLAKSRLIDENFWYQPIESEH